MTYSTIEIPARPVRHLTAVVEDRHRMEPGLVPPAEIDHIPDEVGLILRARPVEHQDDSISPAAWEVPHA